MNFDFTNKFADREYVAKLKAALGSMMDLASQNMLDERDVDKELKHVVREQQDDMATVVELYDIL